MELVELEGVKRLQGGDKDLEREDSRVMLQARLGKICLFNPDRHTFIVRHTMKSRRGGIQEVPVIGRH